MIARGPKYYDATYKRIIEVADTHVWDLMRERCAKIASHIEGETVLDVACGLGLLAEKVPDYTGIDFSLIATDYGWKHFLDAEFILTDMFQFLMTTDRCFDTVILSEILEHIAHPARLYELAAAVANERIIWTVPRDLAAPSHLWPVWHPESISLMLSLVEGERVVQEQFGGDDGKRWWLVVQEMGEKTSIDG